MTGDKEFIFLTDDYRGGANTFINNHINYLAKKKQKVILFNQNPMKNFEKLNKNIEIYNFDLNKNKSNVMKILKNRINLDKKQRYFVMTNFAFLIKFYFFFSSFNKNNNKIILTIHSGIYHLNLKYYLAGIFFSLIYKKIDYLFFGSKSAKLWWKKNYPWMNIDKSLIHLNGVRIQKKVLYKKIKKKIKISFAGRIEKENNPELFLRLATEYLKNDSNAIFNIYGDGTLKKFLKKKYKDTRNIIFHGWSKKEMIYKNSNIIVITSPINNFPYVALEAKSYGVPVVSCSKGDIKKIINNGIDGYLSKTISIKKLIILLKKIKMSYTKFSKNCLINSYRFDLDISCQKFWSSVND